MDKYEYKLKLDEMKSLTAEGNYKAAAEIADTINWHKIKNVNALIKTGEIYEKLGRYEESKEILLMAYDRSPIGRMIIYRLAQVAIKMGNYDDAKEYYDEFVEIAPHDNLKYVLRYELAKAQGADVSIMIQILEELKEQEYSEEWAFELACLYHKAGMSEQCIETCDELILWFGDGPYVERALELKMLYQPLTKQQEDKYRQFRQHRDGIVEVRPDEMLESGEIVSETVQIPKISLSAERFNTQNLQEELQRSMQQIIDATEKETVADSMDNIKKLVEDIPFLQIPKEETIPEESAEQVHIETDAEIDDSLKTNFQELLAEDRDGQMSLYVSEKGALESQITGQISIDEVLAEWEKTKRAAEAALQEAEQRKLESAKARALQEAGDIMERLADVIPKLDSGLTPRELLEEQYLGGQPIEDDKAAEMVANMNQLLQQEIDRIALENAQMDQQLAAVTAGVSPEIPEQPTGGEPVPDIEEALLQQALREPVEGLMPEEILQTEAEAFPDLQTVQPELLTEPEEAEVLPEPEEAEILPEPEEAGRTEARTAIEQAGEPVEYPQMEAETGETDRADRQIDMEDALLAEAVSDLSPAQIAKIELAKTKDFAKQRAPRETSEPIPEIAEPEEDDGHTIRRLSDEQREIFTYFIPIRGMEQQLCQALTGAAGRLSSGGSAATGNMIIQGGQGSGKTVLATSVIKALQHEIGKPNGRIGKIEASVLNQRDVAALLTKVAGGCLIIEKAGGISRETAIKLSTLLASDTSGVLVILEDTNRGIEKAMSRDAGFASRFSEKISIPIFTSDELVSFAKSYAKEGGYSIDEMGVLALYNCISNIQKLDEATTLTEVKEIVDQAIAHAERGGIKKAFSIIASRRYDDEDYIILHERDFGF